MELDTAELIRQARAAVPTPFQVHHNLIRQLADRLEQNEAGRAEELEAAWKACFKSMVELFGIEDLTHLLSVDHKMRSDLAAIKGETK